MKKRWIAGLAALALLLTGCDAVDFAGFWNGIRSLFVGRQAVDFSEMTYTRPDPEEFQATLDQSCQVAAQGTDLSQVLDQIWTFYDAYDWVLTMSYLTEIHYCTDLTDPYWQEEHDYCMDMRNQASEALDTLYRALAASPHREELESDDYFGDGFFDSYEGESVWDDTFRDLMVQENQLMSQYYTLSSQVQDFDQYADQLQELFVDLVGLRQQIAAYAGYDSYPEFAYDWYFYRDYTPEQATDLLQQVQQELTPLYCQLIDSGFWDQEFGSATPAQALSYIRDTANAMGGTVEASFELMEQYHLYNIDASPNKYNGSFEVFLPSYGEPFLFLNPSGSSYDRLSLAHEFGHFCNDNATYGNVSGTDVAEVFSQGMEYLSLCYGNPTELLTQLKLANCLDTYVEQSAYAAFEHQVYSLTGDNLTVEHVQALFQEVATQYGLDLWQFGGSEYATVPHFFTEPMYIVSYVVSNDAAFQLYQMEQEEPGSGLAVYMDCLETSADGFMAFLEEAGLESPFAPGQIKAVADTLEQVLA